MKMSQKETIKTRKMYLSIFYKKTRKKSTVAIEILYFLCEKCEKTRRNEKDFEISGNLKNCFTTAKNGAIMNDVM